MTILVTGASGKVGQQVLQQLMQKGEKVRASSRNPENANLPSGIEIVAMDLEKPETLGDALLGISKIFLYTKPQGIDNFVKAAKDAGVEHIVLLSSSSVTHSSESASFLTKFHMDVENAIENSGINYTFLRPGAFASNALNWKYSIKSERVVRLPYPNSHSTPIHEDDIASVAVTALTKSGFEGTKPLLTGPQSLTQRMLVDCISEAIGEDISFIELTPDQAREQMSKFMDSKILNMMLGYWAEADNKVQEISNEVERITGKPAKTFLEWAKDHKEDFK